MANVLELARRVEDLVTCDERTFVAFAVAVSFSAFDYVPVTEQGLVNIALKLCIEKRHSVINAKKILGYLRDFAKAGYLDYNTRMGVYTYTPKG